MIISFIYISSTDTKFISYFDPQLLQKHHTFIKVSSILINILTTLTIAPTHDLKEIEKTRVEQDYTEHIFSLY